MKWLVSVFAVPLDVIWYLRNLFTGVNFLATFVFFLLAIKKTGAESTLNTFCKSNVFSLLRNISRIVWWGLDDEYQRYRATPYIHDRPESLAVLLLQYS
jgi:hypothetical protein